MTWTWPINHPRATLGAVAALVLLGLVGLSRFREQDDILAFLPASEPDVITFRDVARRFGALRVALIGVEPPSGTALFSSETLGRLERLSGELRNVEGVDRVVSLSTMTDLDPSAGSVEVRPLVPSPVPTDAAALRRIETRALSLPQVRGNIVSPDGKAALVLVFLTEAAKTRKVAQKAQELARANLPGSTLYFGGAPFAGQAIYDDTQMDVRRLTPLALLLFFVVVLASFRDWLAVALTVGTVGVAGIVVTGGMGLFGEPFTVVTAMLPVILFAAGSQYAIHILGRYYLLRTNLPAREAALGAVRIAGPPVSIATLATSLGFLSFLVMNVRPMRSFGVACALGIFVCWLLSLTVLPAVVNAWPRPYEKHGGMLRLEDRLMALWTWVQAHRLWVVGGAVLLLLGSARFAMQVEVRMEPRAFFRPGSEPARAQTFLDERFGGSQFMLLATQGDIMHPLGLRELRRLSNYARALPGVTQVQSILDVLRLVGDAMNTGGSLPAEPQQVGNLLFFIEGEPSVRALLTPDRKAALLQVRFQGEPKPVLFALEKYLARRWPYVLHRHSLDDLAEEVGWILGGSAGLPARATAIRAALETLSGQAGQDPSAGIPDEARMRLYQEALREALEGEDGQGLTAAQRQALLGRAGSIRSALLRGGPGGWSAAGQLSAEIPEGMTQDQLDVLLGAAKERFEGKVGAWALQQGQDRVLAASGVALPKEARAHLAQLLADVMHPARDAGKGVTGTVSGEPPEGALRGRVSGEPVLDRGFSRAVEQNQWASLRIALVAVFMVLLFCLRSVSAAVICMLPAGLALAVSFGALGLAHRPIDIGTSLVGSIVTGSGADFAMHYMWYLRRNHPREVVRNVGPLILITAVLLGAGLGVLGFSSSPPLRLFGWLAAGGMLLSGAFTFLLVPALLRKTRSERRDFG